ncbi:MAG: UDP-N-acetylmuramoyl-L-alanine--D-glutamate ligase [Nitrospirota bacterium]|jgi:UDP-N-acetylmuramoylalanine--D-glutamate ligase
MNTLPDRRTMASCVPDLSGRTYVVIGAGRSGVAAASFLARAGAEVRLTDREMPAVTVEPAVELFFGGHAATAFAGVDEVVISPGVPRDGTLVQGLIGQGIPVVGEVELAWRHSQRPILGVTGTNGKSTTVTLLHAMLVAAGEDAVLGGNIGTPLIDVACDDGTGPCVAELSSYQLESIVDFAPRVACLLNVTPDHEDRYPSLAAYLAAKARIFENQGDGAVGIVSLDDPCLAGLIAGRLGFTTTGGREAAAWVEAGWLRFATASFAGPLVEVAALGLRGPHNVENALAAGLAALAWGVPPESVATTLCAFTGLAHRGEVVANVGGVAFADNSKATNIGAVARVLEGYREGEVVLIAGGSSKGGGFADLRRQVGRAVRQMLVIGATAERLADDLAGCCPIERVGTLEAAVGRAASVARPGDTVLLAPACASFDQFRNYEHRGETFRALVLQIAGTAT